MRVRILCTLAVAMAAAMALPAHAVLVDNFDSYAPGTVAATGMNVTGGVWSTIGANTATIQDLGGNRILTVGAGGNDEAWRALPAGTGVADGATSTLFFRIRSTVQNPNLSVGLSAHTPTTDDFNAFNAQMRISDNGSSATTFNLDVRNGAAFQNVASNLAIGTWYNIWMVVNSATDTYNLYHTTGVANATQLAPTATNVAFRTGALTAASNPLVNLLVYGGAGPVLGNSVDDVHITSGLSLTNPAFPAAVPGDTDGDGVVEDSDLTPISTNFLNTVVQGAPLTMRAQGDLNLDGVVNFLDFREWKTARFPVAPAGSSVPEPAAATLAAVALALLVRPRRD